MKDEDKIKGDMPRDPHLMSDRVVAAVTLEQDHRCGAAAGAWSRATSAQERGTKPPARRAVGARCRATGTRGREGEGKRRGGATRRPAVGTH